jgi:hypothetical protein
MASRMIIDASAGGSIIELTQTQAFTLFKKVADNDTWASSGCLLLVQPTGNVKESCKWRRKTYSKSRLIRSCEGWRIWRQRRKKLKT